MSVTLHLVAFDKVYFHDPRGGTRLVTLSCYDVRLDGVTIGSVARQMVNRERKTRGRTYVNLRWRAPAWTYGTETGKHGRREECLGRRDGIERLLRQVRAVSPQDKALARAAVVVRGD